MTTIIYKRNIKIKDKDMETNTSINDINLSIIDNKNFTLWLKERIKSLVLDQKIAKRDRKDSRHPCPEKRKYSPYEAWMRVLSNRTTLYVYYTIYHVLRHTRDVRWEDVVLKKNINTWTWSCGHALPDGFMKKASELYPDASDYCWLIRRGIEELVVDYIKSIGIEVREQKALRYN